MSGSISAAALLVALVLAVVVVFKVVLYFWLFTRFRLRARGSLFASLVLANYSEFGLIVGSIAVANGWLSGDWLMIIALALTMTFIAAAPLNARSHEVFGKFRARLTRFETAMTLPEDAPVDLRGARIAVIGMGRVGTGAYNALKDRYAEWLVGIETDTDRVRVLQEDGRHVIRADATDDEFWERACNDRISVVLLALPELEQNLSAMRHIGAFHDDARVFAVIHYPEEEAVLKAAGVKAVWNMHAEAGIAFAEDVRVFLEDENTGTGETSAPDTSPRSLPTGA